MSFDTIIVGGLCGAIGRSLSRPGATLGLVLDTGAPRNRFAAASHGFFAQDGNDPRAMLETMHGQVAAYPTVRFRDLKAMDAAKDEDGFRVTLDKGEAVTGSKLLLAFGSATFCPSFQASPNVGDRPSSIAPTVTATSSVASGLVSSISRQCQRIRPP